MALYLPPTTSNMADWVRKVATAVNFLLRGSSFAYSEETPAASFFKAADFFLPSNFAVTINDGGPDSPSYATPSHSAQDVFDTLSTARTAPGLTYWVDPQNGNDTTGDGLSEATAWMSITKATSAAISAGQSVKIMLRGIGSSDAGDPIKGFNFTSGSVSALYDLTVDCCVIFYNGASVLGVHNNYAAPSLHTGASYTYSISNTLADNVIDLSDVDSYSIPKAMTYVPFVASGDIPPGCWAYNDSTVLIRRTNNGVVTNDICRILEAAPNVRTTNNISLGFFPQTDADTLRIYGGGSVNGAFDINIPSSVTDLTPRAVCAKNVTCINYGFVSSGAGRCWSIDGLHGIAYLQNCAGFNARTDAFNFHNTRGLTVSGVKTRILTVNCISRDCGADVRAMGASNFISNNGHTLHDDVMGVDYGGDYRNASGGCVLNIGTSKSLYVGTLAHDRGDRWLGSTTYPTGFRSQDSAEIYCYKTKVPFSTSPAIDYHVGGGAIYQRDCWPSHGGTFGALSKW